MASRFHEARALAKDRAARGNRGRRDVSHRAGVCDRTGSGGGWGADTLTREFLVVSIKSSAVSRPPMANHCSIMAHGLWLIRQRLERVRRGKPAKKLCAGGMRALPVGCILE